MDEAANAFRGLQIRNSLSRSPPRKRELKLEDALSYIEQVKLEFGEQSQIYNDLLDVMKDFKEQAIDTPGVIERVKTLFRGHHQLILGFNAFLPDGYSIRLSDLMTVTDAGSAAPSHMVMGGPAAVNTAPAPAAASSAAAGNLADFDLAISYVTKIKNRFNTERHTYKTFLELLRAYESGQLRMLALLEQVSVLFADHPDLLRELAHFMPDGAKDEAIAWSNRAALKAEMRRAALLIDFSRGNSHTANARSSSSSPLPSSASSARDDASMETD